MRRGATEYNTGRRYDIDEHNPRSYAHVPIYDPYYEASKHLSHVRPWDAERRPYIPNNSREFSALSARPKTSLQVSTKKYPANFDEYNEVRKKLKADIEREFKLSDNLRSYIRLKKNKDRTIEEYETLKKLRDKTRLEYDSFYEYYRANFFYNGKEINDTGKEIAKTRLSDKLIIIREMGKEITEKKTERDNAYSEYKKANKEVIKVIKLAKEREAVLNKTYIKDENYLESANNNLLVDEISTEIIASYSSGGYKSVKRVAKRPVNKVAKRPVNKVAKRPVIKVVKRPTKKPVKKPTAIPTKRPAKPSAKPTKRPAKRPVRK